MSDNLIMFCNGPTSGLEYTENPSAYNINVKDLPCHKDPLSFFYPFLKALTTWLGLLLQSPRLWCAEGGQETGGLTKVIIKQQKHHLRWMLDLGAI